MSNIKKKIGIVTILDVANFGSMLQAYALGTIIQRLNYEVEFVNYWRQDYTTKNKVRTFLKDKTLGNVAKRCLFALAALLFYAPIRIRVRHFVTKKFKFTRKYTSFNDIKNNPPNIDIGIFGSDQIWNSSYNGGLDRIFWGDFGSFPHIAYAASSGLESFENNELPEIKHLLANFKSISVRESQTCEYLHNLGFPEVQHVLDPSLLLTAEEWKVSIGYQKNTSKRAAMQEYLLVYSVERFNNDFIFSQARRIADKLNLKVYVVCTTYPVKAKKYGVDKIYAMANVPVFLRLIADAKFIIASSFHGTAFAINFNKDFITISPNKYNIRMESIVKQFGLEDRVIKTNEIDIFDLKSINYETINTKLTQARKDSLSFIRSSLS